MSLNEPPAKRQRGETDRDENFIYILDEEDTPEDEKSSTCMESWLDEISLPHLAELFDSAEIDMSLVAHLSAEDLIELGIDSAHERQLILEHAKRKLEGCKTSGHRHPSSAVMAVVGKLAEIPKLPANRDRGKITSFFFPINGQVSTSLVDMRPIGVRFDPSSLNHDPAPGGTLDSGLASTSAASSSSNASLLARARSSPLPHDTTLSKNIPRWKKLPGTRMTVDCFAEISKDLKGCPYWVLSHFHSDHYRGLGKKFNQGIIICTEVTGRLIEQRLKIPRSIILTLPFNVPMMIEGSTIELIDANHCPGAAMILCETPAKVTVLHCGDCRLARHHQSHPSLVRTRGTAMLILDTTYCDPQYNFPPQSETIDFVFQEIKREAFNPRCLILFGSYTIGKERLVLEVARRLEKKVYVSKDKMSILECCDIPSEYRSLLTTGKDRVLETGYRVIRPRSKL